MTSPLRSACRAAAAAALAAVLAACSTVTPYPSDSARHSPLYGKLTRGEAVDQINSKIHVVGDYADPGSLLIDEIGFGFKKTTHSETTALRDGQTVTNHHTEWRTRTVSWDSVTRVSAYLRDYQYVFTDEYRVEIRYNFSTVEDGHRATRDEEIELSCRSQADLLDVLAALAALTGT